LDNNKSPRTVRRRFVIRLILAFSCLYEPKCSAEVAKRSDIDVEGVVLIQTPFNQLAKFGCN
jgi:hypothetical protein